MQLFVWNIMPYFSLWRNEWKYDLQQATVLREDLPGFIFESNRGTKHSFTAETTMGAEFVAGWSGQRNKKFRSKVEETRQKVIQNVLLCQFLGLTILSIKNWVQFSCRYLFISHHFLKNYASKMCLKTITWQYCWDFVYSRSSLLWHRL